MKEAMMRRAQRLEAEGQNPKPAPQKRSRSEMEELNAMVRKAKTEEKAFLQREDLVPLGSFNMKGSTETSRRLFIYT